MVVLGFMNPLPTFLKQKDASIENITEKRFRRLGHTTRENFAWFIKRKSLVLYEQKAPVLSPVHSKQKRLPLSHDLKTR